MATYIGKRIVPVHCGKWDKSKNYEMLSIVLEESSSDSYIARRSVPSGTAITDTYYWMLHSLYSQQIKDMSDQLSATEARIKADNDETERTIKKDNDETEAAIKQDNASTKQTVESRVSAAESALAKQKTAYEASETQLNARMDAVLKAGTGAGDTEIIDARVDANGNEYASLGEAVRRSDGYLSRVQKIPFIIREHGESDAIVGTGSTITGKKIENCGVFAGAEISLIMNNQEKYPGHWIRSYVHIPKAEFQEKYDGKKICVQMWSSTECNVFWSYGFWPAINERYTVCIWQRLHPGYNELIIDTNSGEYKSKEIAPDYDFYVNYLFGAYQNRPLMDDGEYTFRLSMYVDEDLGYGLPGVSGAAEAVFAAHSVFAEQAEESTHAEKADHALEADSATIASHAGDARRAGAVSVIKTAAAAQLVNTDYVEWNQETGLVDVRVTSDMWTAKDSGFTLKLGTMEELRGSTIIFYREEVQPYTAVALNAGSSWGNQTYGTVTFKHMSGNYWVADFDDLFAELRRKSSYVSADYDGVIYMMVFWNDNWTLPEEGDEFHNYYAVYQVNEDSFVYTPMLRTLSETVADLGERTEALEESVPTEQIIKDLRDRCTSLEEALEAVKAGNVLWGKKYFATGDSFTEGDFSGWTDEDGNAGKNSPVIYDSEWKMYRTYPWWIARRNNMTLINDGNCGSIMALSKEYLNGDEGVPENSRQPFSLTRYKNIPADVDYITLWFGINDSSHTNLGTLSDTTNETYYGAWNVVMEYLITNYPYAKIGIIITDLGSASYRQATREIAIKWGIPYLDMMGSDQTPVIFGRESNLGLSNTAYSLRRNAFLVAPTNGHPNLEAHKYQSTFVEDFLRRL